MIFKNKTKLIGEITYVFFLALFTFLAIESTIEILKNKKNISDKLNQLDINKNINISFKSTILSMKPDLVTEKIYFRTDEFGSIKPTDLEGIENNQKYILFCGGSTTESSHVSEDKRSVAVFSKNNKNLKAINYGKAGRGLEDCISLISNINDLIINKELNNMKPRMYVIATNYNTLSDFLRSEFNKKKKNISKNTFGRNIYKFINKNYIKAKRNKVFKIKISNYENAILDGCCFSPSNINNPNQLPNAIRWQSKELTKKYSKYISGLLNQLESVQIKYNISDSEIVFFIEPHSFEIKYSDIYRPYWRDIDGRQSLYDFDGNKIDHKISGSIMDSLNQSYVNGIKGKNYRFMNIDSSEFPKYSFYDSVHYTEYGSQYLAEFFNLEINKLLLEDKVD